MEEFIRSVYQNHLWGLETVWLSFGFYYPPSLYNYLNLGGVSHNPVTSFNMTKNLYFMS